MELGTVKFFNEQKGFGFIERPGEKDDLFFHKSNVKPGLIAIKDMAVTFVEIEGVKGPEASLVDTQVATS